MLVKLDLIVRQQPIAPVIGFHGLVLNYNRFPGFYALTPFEDLLILKTQSSMVIGIALAPHDPNRHPTERAGPFKAREPSCLHFLGTPSGEETHQI